MTGTLASALILAAFAVAVGAGAVALDPGSLRAPGPGLYPLLLALMLGALAVALGVRGVLQPRAGPAAVGRSRQVGATVVALGAYGAVLPVLGFPPATLALLVLLFRIGGLRSWWRAAGIAFVATAAAAVLARVLDVPLPAGALWP